MAQTAVILIRVVLGLILGFAGLIAFGWGLYTTFSVDFPSFGLVLMMLMGLVIGCVLLFAAWRLLSATLRFPAQLAL